MKSTPIFVKVERECPHNAGIREAGETRGILYDYEVIEAGQRVAMFLRDGSYYVLADMTGERIRREKNGFGFFEIRAETKRLFADVYAANKQAGLVPTAAQIEARTLDRQEAKEAARQERAEQERLFKIREAAPQLLASLIQCLNYIEHSQANKGKLTNDAEWDANVAEFRKTTSRIGIGRSYTDKAFVDLVAAREAIRLATA